jgi:hypothetical protein
MSQSRHWIDFRRPTCGNHSSDQCGQPLEPRAHAGRPYIVLQLFQTANLDSRSVSRVFQRHPLGDVLLCLCLDVVVIHVAVKAPPVQRCAKRD